MYAEILDIKRRRLPILDAAVAHAFYWASWNRPYQKLKREEKSAIGVGIERELCEAFGWPRDFSDVEFEREAGKNNPDTVVGGVPVEIKASCTNYFGVRKGQEDHWSFLVDIDDKSHDYRVAIRYVRGDDLNPSTSDASKRNIKASARKKTDWCIDSNFRYQLEVGHLGVVSGPCEPHRSNTNRRILW